MKRLRDQAGSQALLGIGLLALNLAVLLVLVGASSLLVQQRALNTVSDALALDLADWLRANRDDPDVYPAEWESTVRGEHLRLLRASTVGQLGVSRIVRLQVEQDRLVSVRLCADSWLGLGPSVQVCVDSAATEG